MQEGMQGGSNAIEQWREAMQGRQEGSNARGNATGVMQCKSDAMQEGAMQEDARGK